MYASHYHAVQAPAKYTVLTDLSPEFLSAMYVGSPATASRSAMVLSGISFPWHVLGCKRQQLP